jgi:hypothetical protein
MYEQGRGVDEKEGCLSNIEMSAYKERYHACLLFATGNALA